MVEYIERSRNDVLPTSPGFSPRNQARPGNLFIMYTMREVGIPYAEACTKQQLQAAKASRKCQIEDSQTGLLVQKLTQSSIFFLSAAGVMWWNIVSYYIKNLNFD